MKSVEFSLAHTFGRVACGVVSLGLLAVIAGGQTCPGPGTLPQGFPGEPVLANRAPLTSNAQTDSQARIAFSPTTGTGLIFWTRRYATSGGTYEDLMMSRWNGFTWLAESVEASGAPPSVFVRHREVSLTHSPTTSEVLVSFHTNNPSSMYHDEVATLRGVASPAPSWSPQNNAFFDGGDDDDRNGAVRYSAAGDYAVAVWSDDLQPSSNRAVVAHVWNPSTSSWTPRAQVQAGAGAFPVNKLWPDRCLAQDPSDGQWIVAYSKDADVFAASNEVVYRKFTAGASPAAGISAIQPEVPVSTPAVAHGVPAVEFDGSGRGGIFWTQDFGAGGELMGAFESPSGAYVTRRLTCDADSDTLLEVEPGPLGWHLLLARAPSAGAPASLYYVWCDGVRLSSPVPLAPGLDVQAAALGTDSAGDVHIVMRVGDGTASEIHTARLQFPQLTVGVNGGAQSLAGATIFGAVANVLSVGTRTSAGPLSGAPVSTLVTVGSPGLFAQTSVFGLVVSNFELVNVLSTRPGAALLLGDGLGLGLLGVGPLIGAGPSVLSTAFPPVAYGVAPGLIPSGTELAFQGLVLDVGATGLPLRATNVVRILVF